MEEFCAALPPPSNGAAESRERSAPLSSEDLDTLLRIIRDGRGRSRTARLTALHVLADHHALDQLYEALSACAADGDKAFAAYIADECLDVEVEIAVAASGSGTRLATGRSHVNVAGVVWTLLPHLAHEDTLADIAEDPEGIIDDPVLQRAVVQRISSAAFLERIISCRTIDESVRRLAMHRLSDEEALTRAIECIEKCARTLRGTGQTIELSLASAVRVRRAAVRAQKAIAGT